MVNEHGGILQSLEAMVTTKVHIAKWMDPKHTMLSFKIKKYYQSHSTMFLKNKTACAYEVIIHILQGYI